MKNVTSVSMMYAALALNAFGTTLSTMDYASPEPPAVHDHHLHILTGSILELKLINTKAPDPASVSTWDFVKDGRFEAPPANFISVTADGKKLRVSSVHFKRRPFYAPLLPRDLRVENSLYLVLSSPVSEGQRVEVSNPNGKVWSSSLVFATSMDPLRYSPAIHVNQEGYMPGLPKKAMVGYYAGDLGEVQIPTSAGFKLVEVASGQTVFRGSLVRRPDIGYTYTPTPYQQVFEADFTSFNTPGEYRLLVPSMGASLSFLIHPGIATSFTRAYALGLYHQRCGAALGLPHTRFARGDCHSAPALVPAHDGAPFSFTWNTIASYASQSNPDNPPQIAPALTSPAAQLFPFVNVGPNIEVSGGHHDAGDYSKYTINSAHLVHYLTFVVDSLGLNSFDNLGIPQSGDGISDLIQEAKWEGDFLAKMQDADGGFYFLVYPQNRQYEYDVLPENGDPQVVWPKTSSATAAAVAALAQLASSPAFRSAYPTVAETYLEKARLGWQFLLNAIEDRGKDGIYQKITHYGDNYADKDELAWAACQMFLATGDETAHSSLLSWFDPSDPATWRWGWWRMSECYGHAIRSYAFAVQSGRVAASALNSTYLEKCRQQIAKAGQDNLTWSKQSAYGTSFPQPTKAFRAAGWYFSTDQAFDIAVAHRIDAKHAYLEAMLANLNYEAGCNPVNVSYVTGLGWRRTRNVVNQWALNDPRALPPSGLPVGNIQQQFYYLWTYNTDLNALCYPSDTAATAPYPFYDRWGDVWNVSTEMVNLNSARSLGTVGLLASGSSHAAEPWTAPLAQINVSGSPAVGTPLLLNLQPPPTLDLSNARLTWEGRDHSPVYGPEFTFTPVHPGTQWVEVEAHLPDGRRVFARHTFTAQ